MIKDYIFHHFVLSSEKILSCLLEYFWRALYLFLCSIGDILDRRQTNRNTSILEKILLKQRSPAQFFLTHCRRCFRHIQESHDKTKNDLAFVYMHSSLLQFDVDLLDKTHMSNFKMLGSSSTPICAIYSVPVNSSILIYITLGYH